MYTRIMEIRRQEDESAGSVSHPRLYALLFSKKKSFALNGCSFVSTIYFLFHYQYRPEQDWMVAVLLTLSLAHVVDFALKAYVTRFRFVYQRLHLSLLNTLELVSTVLSTVVFALLLSSPEPSSLMTLTEVTLFLRISRLFLISIEMHYINDLFFSLQQFWPFFKDLFAVLFIFCYVWGILGQHLMGELANPEDKDIYYSNFNDLVMSYILLLRFILKWWGPEVALYQADVGSRYISLFFFAFYFIVNYYVLNILLSCVMDYLMYSYKKQERVMQIIGTQDISVVKLIIRKLQSRQ